MEDGPCGRYCQTVPPDRVKISKETLRSNGQDRSCILKIKEEANETGRGGHRVK